MVISLPWPPTVNTYYRAVNGRNILSKRGRQYKETAFYEIKNQVVGGKPMTGPVALYVRAYPPDRRRRDIDNILKPILDALTNAGVYEDDFQVSDLRVTRFEQAKPGRIEVVVSEG